MGSNFLDQIINNRKYKNNNKIIFIKKLYNITLFFGYLMNDCQMFQSMYFQITPLSGSKWTIWTLKLWLHKAFILLMFTQTPLVNV